uniref:Retrovirus-related Pol polyprotein from transposon TNT 1-94 n=1 Tax=Tanacetum cinerariifolium TaxID=118510 RepID=A0A699JJI4_TANCI|nr:retrovirus-related Pol polyprotein from transposon TNT 1-94 [Tanacetum cinerariifolium]
MVPKAVLMRSGLVSLSTARPVNTAQPRTTVNSARLMKNIFNKADSTVRRPINKTTTFKNSDANQKVNIVRSKIVNTARPKAIVNVVLDDMLPLEKTSKKGKSQAKAKAVNTACYVKNRVLVVRPHNKTPYELFNGKTPALGFMRPFGCLVTILDTKADLGKFDGKADEGFFVGYSINSKAFRVFNSRTKIVEENLHIRFSENTPNIAGSRPNWLFDIDALKNQ